jgi:outer membrane protein TolC
LLNIASAEDIGSFIDEQEYPQAQNVLPKTDFVIQGGIEKNIDMTLERCLELALGNNPQINAAFQDILASDVRVKQVWSSYFPRVGWQTGYTKIRQLQLSDALGRNLTFNYWLLGQVSLQQMLYDFGVTQNKATIKKLDYEAYKTTLAAVINDVIFQTKDAYYNLLYAFEQRKVAHDTVDKFEVFYNQAKAFYEIGMNPKVDVTIAEVNLSNAKLQLIQADNAVNLAEAKLNNIMGVPFIDKYNVKERLNYSPLSMNFNNAVDIARKSRPELKSAEIKVENARQTLQLVKKSYFPTLSVEGQLQYGGNTPTSNHGYNYGAYLNFPTVNGMLIRNEIKEARYLYDKELANAKITQNSIYLEIQNAYLNLEEKKNQLPVAILGVKKAKENYELSYGRYRVGEASPTELKDAQINYQQAQLNYYSALYQYNSCRAQLEKAIGRNIAEHGEIIDLEN